ncbi:DinB family protein [uncultured Tateyamaria sp.]|uniref:DinB family protein n=1 Tax=uncultured Tateyamaria sp. TaxID=455651 RepID=UPI00260D4AF0|nr:DinB family protein [uncultured Tateyamaria sp.]
MIEAGYVRSMARYNAWQNRQLTTLLTDMTDAELREDRGAFFGSIMATLNHILWGDTLWMSRFEPRISPPGIPPAKHAEFTPTFAVWTAERFRMDGAIRMWADTLRTLDLKGELSWYSGTLKRDFQQPFANCVVHFFNHQIHHRGQVHAMMTAAGGEAPVSDMVFMPEDE